MRPPRPRQEHDPLFESRLRADLAHLAEQAPTFQGIQPAPEPLTHQNTHQGSVLSNRGRPGRRASTLALAAGLVAAGGLIVTHGWSHRDTATPSGMSCAGIITFHDRQYQPAGRLMRTPAATRPLGTATQPGCDDGAGATPARTLTANAIPGVDPSVAIIVDDSIALPHDTSTPPAVATLLTPIPCRANITHITGTIATTYQDQPAPADGPPFTVLILTTQSGLLHDPTRHDDYTQVAIPVTITIHTHTRPDDARSNHWTSQIGHHATLATTCTDNTWTATTATTQP